MSINISPAYKLDNNDFFEFVQRMRTFLVPELNKVIYENYVAEALKKYDISENVAFRDVLNQVIKDTQKDKDSFLARYFKSQVVFFRNYVRDETYAILYDMPVPVVHSFADIEGVVEDYSYWNSSDSQLQKMSQAEWKDRITAWEETIDLREATGPQGVSVRFFNQHYASYFVTVEKIEEAWDGLILPSFETRFNAVLLEVYTRSNTQKFPEAESGEMFQKIMEYLIADDKASSLPYANLLPVEAQQAVDDAHSIMKEKTLVTL